MTPKQVRNYYGTPTKFAESTGYSRMVLYQWESLKYVPKASQALIEVATFGQLKMSPPYGVRK